MDLNKIRNMSDKELESYLRGLTSKKTCNCIKCDKPNSNYTINVQNKKKGQQKKLCNLCETCYGGLLDYLDTVDIIWD